MCNVCVCVYVLSLVWVYVRVEPEAVSGIILICSLSLFLEVGSRSTPGLADIATLDSQPALGTPCPHLQGLELQGG